MRVKKLIGRLHLWLGLSAGLVIFIVALTGSLLVFEDELDPALFAKELRVTSVGGKRMTIDELVASAAREFPGKKVSRVKIWPETNRTVLVTFGNKKKDKSQTYAYIDPYSGRITGKGQLNKRFFAKVRELHRFLLAGKTGKTITGISCSFFLILLFSGLVMWWPAAKGALRQRFRIKRDGSFRRVNWDVHAVLGFYASIFLFFIATTGLAISYKWVNNMIVKMADGKFDKPAVVTNRTGTGEPPYLQLLEKVVAETDRLFPNSGAIMLLMPGEKGQAITANKELGAGNTVVNTAYFDSRSGETLRSLQFSELSRGNKIRRLILPIHTGYIYGTPTKLLALLLSLFAASLPLTGFLIWAGKKKKAKKKKTVIPPDLVVINK